MEKSENLVRRTARQPDFPDVTQDEIEGAGESGQADVTSQPGVVVNFTDYEAYGGNNSMGMAYDQLVVILSGLYGILLVVIGLVLPTTEAMCNARSMQGRRFEIFYIYLYLVSILFLVYVYAYLLRNYDGISLASVSERLTRSFKKNSDLPETSSVHPSMSSYGRSRNTKVYFLSKTNTHTGSFYLRVGAIGFGVGSMIHSAIMFGHFLEMTLTNHSCSDVMQALKPFTHMCFTVAQMYFIFMNSKISIHKYQSLARFGLMHMCSTNICVWLRSIVVETMQVMKVNERKQFYGILGSSSSGGHVGSGTVVDGGGNHSDVADHHQETDGESQLPELKCHSDAVMGRLQESSSVYLFPCTIQYSLICAGVLCVMWYNVGEGRPRMTKSSSAIYTSSPADAYDDDDDDRRQKTHRISVDCAGSSQGLFLGMAVLVAALCCLIWFYVLIGNSDSNFTAGSLLGHLSEDVIYLLTLIATIVAAVQMKNMQFSLGLQSGIDEVLTLVSLGGLGLFGTFSIVASMFYLHTLDGQLTVFTNVVMLVQAACQATFILACLKVSAINDTQARQKPGRNSVTFLLVSNFTLWLLNTFETQSLEHNVVQVDFYGSNAWSIFSHISVPLGIYFRFHSTVCLSNIWKNAWKTSKGNNS